MFDFMKRVFKRGSSGDIYKGVKDPREALLLMKESRKRDEARKRDAMTKIEELVREDDALMAEGKLEKTSEQRRLLIARQIKQLREDKRVLENKIAGIYAPRLRALNEYISAIETSVELEAEKIPTNIDLEQTAIKAKTLLEDLEIATQMAVGMGRIEMGGRETGDPEELAIMEEMKAAREAAADEREVETKRQTKLRALDRMIDRGLVDREEVKRAKDPVKLAEKKIAELEKAEEEEF